MSPMNLLEPIAKIPIIRSHPIRWSCLILGIFTTLTAGAFDGAPQPSASKGSGAVSQKQNNVDVSERQLAEKGMANLHAAYGKYFKALATLPKVPAPKLKMAQIAATPELQAQMDAKLPAPQRRSLAMASTAPPVDPDELRSENGRLDVTLLSNYTDAKIGTDPVHLRSYNGKLVGPTLHLKPGDTLHVTLKNELPGERWLPNMMNTLNSFNTTNLHFHGLHVSPNGISDNVLIDVGPHQTQEYIVQIPKTHTPGTYWYHPHRHGSTAGDVASSMSGALIIEGGLDDIPEIKAMKEHTMVFNQIPYIYQNTLIDPNTNQPVTFNLKAGEVEAKYAQYIFGPGSWSALGRYTTVNGVVLPNYYMQPGEIQRWRFVDSGQRESLHLVLQPSQSASTIARSPINFQEIAVDGLALGKMETKPMIEMWPGYRSDVLVQAPSTPGEYLLINMPASGLDGLNSQQQALSYVAKITIGGSPVSMKLPKESDMAGLRLPSIQQTDVTGYQTARYGIFETQNLNFVFTIDGKSFTMESARELKLNDVDEWTIRSINGVGAVTHPFHIHVNPFEVISIKEPVIDANGNEVTDKYGNLVMKEDLTSGPVWRDTVKIPGDGYVVMRTRYTDFIGTFVQHCHILDHEDQGMMELIDIVDPKYYQKLASNVPKVNSPAPTFALPNADGKNCSLGATKGKPTVVFFFKGRGCVHCSQQVGAFTAHYKEFQKKGIQIIGVTSDTQADLKVALASSPCPFPILADPKGVAFAKFGCSGGAGLQHGTFALDAKHNVVWRTVGASPYLIVTDLLKKLQPATFAKNRATHQNKATSPASTFRLTTQTKGLEKHLSNGAVALQR